MRIDELTGYKSNPVYRDTQAIFKNQPPGEQWSLEYDRPEQLAAFTKYMNARGFTRLGRGNYGVVYEKPGYPWVFKVFKQDPAYMHFLEYAIAHQDNPNLPQVRGRPIKINDTTYAVRLEKLTPLSDADADVYEEIEDMAILIVDNRSYTQEILDSLKEKYPGIARIFQDMNASKYELDISTKNIMRRGNTLVIIDPIFSF